MTRLLRHLSGRRKVQLQILLILMLAGALAEVLSLGAVVPFVTVLASGEQAANYPIVRTLIDLTGLPATSLPLTISIIFSVLVVVAAAIRLCLLWASARFCYGWGHDLSSELYGKTLSRPYSFHISHNSSEIVGAIAKVQMVISNYINPVLNGVIALVLAATIVATLIAIDPVVAVGGAAVFGVSYFCIAMLVRKRLRHLGLVFAKTNDQRIQAVQEGLGGIREVILERAQPVYTARFAAVDAQYRRAQARSEFLSGSPRLIIEAIGMLLIALFALTYVGSSSHLGTLLPVLGALAVGVQRLMPLLQQVYRGWSAMVNAQASLDDVLTLLEYEPEGVVRGSTLPFRGEIQLRNVSFAYGPHGSSQVLQDIDISIFRGERVGIVGATGSGKSTLIDVIMGLLSPTRGRFLIDGHEITPRNASSWQHHIAHVPQSIFLSDASFTDNIAFAIESGSIDMPRVIHAARAAQLHEYISSLPNGYDTVIGERGVKLSGGQRQRIGIARALYRDAGVLVLDEATSALDDATEERVMKSVQELASNRTIIMIAHRISTLRACNRIIELDRGRVSRICSYAELVGQGTVHHA